MMWLADLIRAVCIVGGMFIVGTLAMLVFLALWLTGVV